MERLMKIGNNNSGMMNNDHQIKQEWTNERHTSFLRLMEANFVKNMFHKTISINSTTAKYTNFHNNINNTTTTTTTTTNNNNRLDRFVPDIAESTLDSQPRKPSKSASLRASDPIMTGPSTNQRRRPIAHPYKISHDQVVPQVNDKAGDN